MLKVHQVKFWKDLSPPAKYDGPGPFMVGPEDIQDLVIRYDLLFAEKDGYIWIYLSPKGVGFHT